MKAFQLEIECTMDGGEVLIASVDQRDHAAFEGTEFYASDPPISGMTKTRWLAWNSLSRTGQYAAPWAKFHHDDCAGVIVTDWPGKDDPEELEGEEEPDPSLS